MVAINAGLVIIEEKRKLKFACMVVTFCSDKIRFIHSPKQDVQLLNCLLDKCFGEIRLPGFCICLGTRICPLSHAI